MVDVVRVDPREQARRRPFPEGARFFNLKGKFCCRLAADAAGRHMMDNDKLLYPRVIPGEPLKVADRVAAAGAQR
jgi:hypothetical protein